ncbi:MAG TPA: Rne/Rng family ribonuclease [Candidatus Angelobacter sp.]|nr:Rne/Rng family ribonuclease [Candidatus Angelobacter sp.]
MAKELFVSSTPHETKVAIVEEDQLAEIYYERENEYTLAGSIYKGRVTRVLPGMQSAFVNVGLERDAFLYVSDFLMEEDEDADAIGEVVAKSGNGAAVIESRGPETQQPIEAEQIMPPAESAEEGGQDEEGPETASGENGGQQEMEREGSRRWRGRRRRGRGGRERFGDRGSERGGDGRPAETAAEETGESRQESRGEQHFESRPEHTRAESGRSEPGRPEPGRSEQRPEHSRSDYQRPEPILLPGESISKYQPHGAQQAASVTQKPVKTEKGPRPRPSTEYSIDSAQFAAGSMVLPGESLAKYGKPSQAARTATETVEPEPIPSTNEERGFLQDRESAGPIPHPVEEEGRQQDAEARVEAPGVFHRVEPEQEAAEHTQEAAETIEETGHSLSRKDEQRFEQMNVASVFGGGAAQAEEVEEEPAAEQAEESAPAAATEEPQPWKASRSGVVEEEEIEEEESEIPGYEDDLDLGEFEEMEEEVLGQAGEQLLPMGNELMEAVRDAHVNEHATGKYEAEGLEPEELEAVEEAFALSEAGEDAGEEDEEQAEEGEEAIVEELEDSSAEQRAPAAAGYQQRTQRRGGPERRGGRRGPGGRRMRGRPRHQSARQLPAISDLLKEGQEILVQIAKEPIAKKGARITSHIALPGRYLVYMPTVHHTGVSRKIGSEEERHRLKRIALSERGESQGGFIVRTAAAGAEEQDLRNDIRFLINLWTEIKGRAETSKAPALIYHDLNLVERILRDQVSGSFSAIWADTEQEYERILRFVSRFQPSLVKRVKLYTKETPLFEQFNITDEINKALKSKVWLRSGGYIVINQTEALVAIDINTGKYVGKTARLEDTIVKTNIDAIKEIVRQIRLRDLGGIIVIDFIDMDERRNRSKVMQALEEALKADRAPSKVLQFNDFGLVAITRKRVKQSLERTLGQPCPTCQATGMIKSVTTVCNEIYVELRKMARHFERDVMVRVHPDVAKALKTNNARWLQEMEELVKRTVIVKSDALLHPEQFDIQ